MADPGSIMAANFGLAEIPYQITMEMSNLNSTLDNSPSKPLRWKSTLDELNSLSSHIRGLT